ncbi:MAG: DUF2017 family protein [Actinomycetaceae bacterium]|nr:DUF2017 family protein [Actinomycetaceae bacterium]
MTPCPGGWHVHLTHYQYSALTRAIEELLRLLDPGSSESLVSALASFYDEPTPRPDNPALYLVLPDMSTDERWAGELRTLTEEELRRRKADRLNYLLGALTTQSQSSSPRMFFIATTDAWQWLKGLNDLRFALSASLRMIAPTADKKKTIDEDGPPSFGEKRDHGGREPHGATNETLAIDSWDSAGSTPDKNVQKYTTISNGESVVEALSPSKFLIVKDLYDLLTTWQESLLADMEAQPRAH